MGKVCSLSSEGNYGTSGTGPASFSYIFSDAFSVILFQLSFLDNHSNALANTNTHGTERVTFTAALKLFRS